MPQTAKTATMKKLLLLLAALFAISAGGICCSGSGDDPGEQEKPVDPPPSPDDGVDWSKIDPKATVRGVVTCASAAVQGVVVTDGVNMTRTNKQGAYGLRTSSDKSKLVYLTVPSGYEVESTRGFIPRFYRRVTAPTSVEQVQRHDFTLKKVNNDRHIMIVSADMHIRNRAMIKTTSSATPSICPPKGELDSTTFRRTYLKALRDYVKALPAGVPVYGMNLGDMTQESHWTNANKATLANFVNVCERGGMPIQTFHAIGNHDHDMAVQNIAGDDDSAAELAYISALGPTYYAVNIGKVHYVVFDNTQYVNTGGDRSFAVRLNRRQMDWAQKDADYMPSDVERIVIAWHCPAFRRNPGASSPNPMDNADELLEAKKAFGGAPLVCHPECPKAVRDVSDCVCSTEKMIKVCREKPSDKVIIATIVEMIHRLRREIPDKTVISAPVAGKPAQHCRDMLSNTPEKLLKCLETLEPRIELSAEVIERARKPIERMLEMS